MRTITSIQICVFINAILLCIIFGLVYNIADSKLLRIGFSNDLIILGISIDTYNKYILLHFIIFITEFCYALVYEYANPILYFNVFNEDKERIIDFSKNQLQFYAQALWFTTSLKNSIMLIVSIQQLDILLSKCISYEIAACIVIRHKINKKNFI